MQNKSKIITGVLATTLLIGGGLAYANTKQTPVPVATTKAVATQPIVPTPTIGKLTLANGEYEGEIKDGLASGQGTLVYRNGDIYKGTFLLGKESGEGSVTQAIDGKTVIQKMDAAPSTEVVTTHTPPKVPLTTPAVTTTTPKATTVATPKDSGIDPKYTRDKFLTDVDYKGALIVWLKRNPDRKAQLTEEDNKLLNDASIIVPARTISEEDEAKLDKKISEASDRMVANMKKTPPAELTQMPQFTDDNRTDPEFIRTLAAWITAHPTVRAYYHGIWNTMEQTVSTNPDERPFPPGYMGEWGGDSHDPDFLNAVADYLEKHPAE